MMKTAFRIRLLAALLAGLVPWTGAVGQDLTSPGAGPLPQSPEPAAQTTGAVPATVEPEKPEVKPPPTSLLLDSPVRSGQSIIFPDGDVTVVGSVSSGAEIVAGGSIHVYGTLRGRAMAGVNGNSSARIYCHRMEAELLAIDGYYQTAEEIPDALRDRPVQALLDGNVMRIAPLS